MTTLLHMGLDLTGARWRSAGPSVAGTPGTPEADGPGDVEVAFVGGSVAVRRSNDPHGTVLIFTPDEWDAFVAGAKAGEFDA